MTRKRHHRCVILLTDAERLALQRAADQALLPISTYARSRLLRPLAEMGRPNRQETPVRSSSREACMTDIETT